MKAFLRVVALWALALLALDTAHAIPREMDPKVAEMAREHLAKVAAQRRVDPRDFVLGKVDFLPPRSEGRGSGTWYIAYTQVHLGLPVIDGSIRLVVTDGRVTSTRAQVHAGIDRGVEPKVGLADAVALVARPGTRPLRSQLVILPRRDGARVTYHLAWELVMPVEKVPYGSVAEPPGTKKPRDDRARQEDRRGRELVPAQFRYRIDAETREILERRNLMRYEDVSGTVTGPVRANVPADPAVSLPISRMRVRIQQGASSFTAETGATGAFTVSGLAPGAATLTGNFVGDHVQVFNDETPDPDATHTASVTAPGSHTWDWSASDPSPSFTETHTFWHVNRIRDWFLRGSPFDVSVTPDPLVVRVRNGPYCNASAGSSGLYFGSGTATCADFSLCSDIVYHEYTHRVVHAVYEGSGVDLYATVERGAMNEAWSDFFGGTLTNDGANGEGCYAGRNFDTPDHRYPDDVIGEVHYDGIIFAGALWDIRTALGTPYVESLALRAMKRVPGGFGDYLGAILEEDDDPAHSTDPATANNDPADGTPNIDAICHSYVDLHGIFHPYCAGHTTAPVAVLTLPTPGAFNLASPTAATLAIEGTALAGAASPFDHFVIEYATQATPTTWLTAGVTLAAGGTAPVTSGALGTLALPGLGDGLYVIRLTVFDAAGATAVAQTSFAIDRSIKAGWPQSRGVRFSGAPAIANLDPAVAGLEIVAAGQDGMVRAWHADGTPVAGWPRPIGWTMSTPAVADLDGDGTLEVVAASVLQVHAFHRDGTAVPGWPRPLGSDLYFGTPAIADLDGDGRHEIIAVSPAQVFAWRLDGTAMPGFPVTPGAQMLGSPAVGDLDGDGRPEIAVGTQDGRVLAFRGDGTAAPGWPQTFAGVNEVSAGVAIGDLDGDGIAEVVAAGSDTAGWAAFRAMVWRGDGTPRAGWPQPLTYYVAAPASAAIADMDGDGVPEVVVMSNDDAIHVFRRDGTTVAGWPPAAPMFAGYEFWPSAPSIADVDGDGNVDVIAEAYATGSGATQAFKMYAFRNDGTALAGWPKTLPTYSNSSPAIADIDLDTHADVAVGTDGIFVWSFPGTYDRRSAEWPAYRHDNRRTGNYLPRAGVVLLFDTSGSMSWRPDGSSPAPVAEQRISLARQAAYPFLEELNDFNEGKARFGIATFPAIPTAWTCDSKAVTPMTMVTTATKDTAVTTTIPGLSTDNSTPLLAGIATAARMLEGQRNASIVLLSDGYHNCPGFASIADPQVAALIARLNAESIRVFSIGFGAPWDPDHPMLEGLASQTTPAGFAGSQFHDVTTPGFDPAAWTPATALQATYKAILVDALGLQAAIDPLSSIAAGANASHPVRVNEHDRRVSFFLSWRTPQKGLLKLSVKASDGSTVPASGTGIRWHFGETYAIVTLDRAYLSATGKVGPTPWRLQVDAGAVPAGGREPYQYSVIVDSSLRFETLLVPNKLFAGEKFLLTAQVLEAGQRLRRPASVRVEVTRPVVSIQQWLERKVVPERLLERIPRKRGGETLTPAQRKALYLQHAGVKYPAPKGAETLRLYDDGTHGDRKAGDGIYSVEIATRVPGIYSYRLHAQGRTAGGLGFDRARTMQQLVPQRPR